MGRPKIATFDEMPAVRCSSPAPVASAPKKIDEAIAPKIEALHADAERQVAELNARDAQDQSWITARAEKLQGWVEKMRGMLCPTPAS